MATITLRQTKGSPLTFEEMDNNLTNLNNDKLEKINNLDVASTLDLNTDYIAIYDASQGDSRKILANAVPFLNRTLVGFQLMLLTALHELFYRLTLINWF
jgi:hypothetical protein